MLDFKILEEKKQVLVNVSGNITKNDAINFLENHKKITKNIRKSQYKLIVEAKEFECESDDIIKKVCMTFYKNGYKKIYILDKKDFILNNMKLSNLEKKMFLKVAKIIKSYDEI